MTQEFPTRAAAEPEAPFLRLWHGFLSARILVALAVLLLQLSMAALGQTVEHFFIVVCAVYLGMAVFTRYTESARLPPAGLGAHWMSTIGVDVVTFSMLQLLQSSGPMNYAPLLGLPILLASVMGSLLLASGTAAGVTLLLLVDAWWQASISPYDPTPRFLQAALTGTGYFVVAFLVHQLASRLASEGQLAKRSQMAATVQVQVNELVIETLGDGVLVVDRDGTARAANPSARILMAGPEQPVVPPTRLSSETGWQPLADLAAATYQQDTPQFADLTLQHAGSSARRVRVRTRLTAPGGAQEERLCVIFLHDLREMEARLRTEKLAAMGRMSAAVAHEIRNPLAAIVQANALLEEDLLQPAQKQLTSMVRQNAQRLARIVEEVLDISRVQHLAPQPCATPVVLDATVAALCREWQQQAPAVRTLSLELATPDAMVEFETDHLRRVLINLLDNAQRYRRGNPDSLQVGSSTNAQGQILIEVWSDGEPMEKAVEDHLFEPFFSSESRSSGLGLYICRELCERNGATIGFRRTQRATTQGLREGNGFVVCMPDRAQAAEIAERPAQYAFDL